MKGENRKPIKALSDQKSLDVYDLLSGKKAEVRALRPNVLCESVLKSVVSYFAVRMSIRPTSDA